MDKFPIFNLQFSIYWLLEFGYWSLVIGVWLLEFGYCLFLFRIAIQHQPQEPKRRDQERSTIRDKR